MNDELILAKVKELGSGNAAGRALNIRRKTVHEIMRKHTLVIPLAVAIKQRADAQHASPILPSAPALAPKRRKTLADFRAVYDKATIIPSRIKAQLKVLGSGGWCYEVEFAKDAGVSLSDLGNFREAFIDHVVPVERGARRAWAGTPETAKTMREMI